VSIPFRNDNLQTHILPDHMLIV